MSRTSRISSGAAAQGAQGVLLTGRHPAGIDQLADGQIVGLQIQAAGTLQAGDAGGVACVTAGRRRRTSGR